MANSTRSRSSSPTSCSAAVEELIAAAHALIAVQHTFRDHQGIVDGYHRGFGGVEPPSRRPGSPFVIPPALVRNAGPMDQLTAETFLKERRQYWGEMP